MLPNGHHILKMSSVIHNEYPLQMAQKRLSSVIEKFHFILFLRTIFMISIFMITIVVQDVGFGLLQVCFVG